MARFTASAASPDVVVGSIGRYSCRNVNEVDQHLLIWRARLPLLTTPQQVRQHREDLDLLLDRRAELAGRLAADLPGQDVVQLRP